MCAHIPKATNEFEWLFYPVAEWYANAFLKKRKKKNKKETEKHLWTLEMYPLWQMM